MLARAKDTKRSKISQNNTAKKDNKSSGKDTRVIDEYIDMFYFMHKPVTETFLEMLCEKYSKWIKSTDSLIFTEFLEHEGIPRSTFYKWLKLSDLLATTHDFVLMTLGNRRERGALKKEYDAGTVAKVQGFYSDIWVSESQRISKLNKDEEFHQNIEVTISKVPPSDLVPLKKSQDE